MSGLASDPARKGGVFSSPLCSDCPPEGYPTDKTRCASCPRLPPLCVELYAGLFGWGEGFVAEGWRVIGFDITNQCRNLGQPIPAGCALVLQDVTTLHGAQFRSAYMIVASPPCEAYSYRAMPWKRAKALPPPDNTLFLAPFRIQAEASAAAGRYIPLIVENVVGAQRWVGSARWHHGSYYLWGDVPALMPKVLRGYPAPAAAANSGAESTSSTPSSATALRSKNGTKILTCLADQDHVKQPGLPGKHWFDHGAAHFSSKSKQRKQATALFARIDPGLAEHIARVFKP